MAIKVLEASFIGSFPKVSQLPDADAPELVMLGRSNVGKSSVINQLLNRKQLAKTSNTPGKTRLMNLYHITVATGAGANKTSLRLIDLPGYGYARVSKTQQAQWQKEFEKLLKNRDSIQLFIQILDARHGPQPNDWQMLSWLQANELEPLRVVLNKMDKLKQTEKAKVIEEVKKALQPPDPSWIVPFSAEKGTGRDALWKTLLAGLKPVADTDREAENDELFA